MILIKYDLCSCRFEFWWLTFSRKYQLKTTFSFSDPFIEDLKSKKLFGLKVEVIYKLSRINPLSAKPTKWANALKQFVGNSLPTNCLSVFYHFVILALKRLKISNLEIILIALRSPNLGWFRVRILDVTFLKNTLFLDLLV